MRKYRHSRNNTIHLGFVPLVDCAPLAMAQELGLFEKHGVEVELHREVGWATIRDKIIYGDLHAAQAPAGLMVAANCGFGCVQSECLTGMVLNLNGNAITLSQSLWKEGVRDGKTLRRAIQQSGRRFTFGVVHNYSSHSFLLRNWLRNHGIEPDRDAHIVVVPPPQMPANLKAGHIDGFCAGEPWNSMATQARTGWTVATSVDLAPYHPEKVVMVRRKFAEDRGDEHIALLSALLEACEFCDRPENRERVIEVLAEPRYVAVPAPVIAASLGGTYNFGNERIEKISNFHVFHRQGANEPTVQRALWVIRGLLASGLVPDPQMISLSSAAEWFRTDIFTRASQYLSIAAAKFSAGVSDETVKATGSSYAQASTT
ncbi:CmpA/NrtA family ABC transporter substrate-binding protein [Verrucomicrobiota bacterium sgz303538]